MAVNFPAHIKGELVDFVDLPSGEFMIMGNHMYQKSNDAKATVIFDRAKKAEGQEREFNPDDSVQSIRLTGA